MTFLVIAAFSLGVHVLVFLSLGLVSGANDHVRAYRRFVGAVALWLGLVVLTGLGIRQEIARPLSGVVAHFLPVIFLVSGAVPMSSMRRGVALGVALSATLLLPFTLDASPWNDGRIEIAYFVLAWGAVAAAVYRAVGARAAADMPVRRRTVAVWLVGGPLFIGLLIAVDAIAVIPLLAALLQAVVLYATVRLSLYEVRAGASRTTALAAGASAHDRRAVAGEITAMIAHEVRNPLTGVRSLAQRIAEDTVDEDRRRRYAALIVREVDRVERMVGALLGASARRGGNGPEVETALGELFEDVSLLVAQRFGRSGVHLVVDATPLVTIAPREPLAQVLLNLLLNAVEQAPAGSRVRLCAREDAPGAIEVVVADSGPGIGLEQRETIFTPFYSGTGGSGLGLAVVRRLADEFAWRVQVSETAGGGATFIVTLPSARRTPAGASHAGAPSSSGDLAEARPA